MSDKLEKLSIVEEILQDVYGRDLFLYEHCTPHQEFLDEWYEISKDKKFTDSFSENWADYLKEITKNVSDDKSRVILGEAFNLASAVACSVMEKFGRIPSRDAPEVGPYSSFRQDLKYQDEDFDILRGILRNPLQREGFDKHELVVNCLDSILKN